MTSGTFVRDTVGLILVRKSFNCFNFYSIDVVDRLCSICNVLLILTLLPIYVPYEPLKSGVIIILPSTKGGTIQGATSLRALFSYLLVQIN